MKSPRLRVPGRLFWILLLGLVSGVARGMAADPQFWQLTFTYSPQGIVLERAALIPHVTKAIRSPGLEDPTVRIDYLLEWIDTQGRVILSEPVTVPLRGRVIMGEGPQAEPHEHRVREFGAFVLRVPGPTDPTTVALVRLVRAAAGGAGAGGPLPPAVFEQPTQIFVVPAPAVNVAPAPGPITSTKVRNSGPDGNRFVIVIMGDGFTSANLGAGTFATKVNSFLNTFFGVSPWSLYSNVVNAYRVDIESAQSGADYEDAAPASGGTLKDTYLNSAFWVGGTERCLYLTGAGESRAFAAADELVGPGVWDEVLVFVNSTKYGGCGGAVGVSSLNSSADEIQIHEFGHSFGSLADEYDYGSTSTNCNVSSARNVDCANNFPSVKWNPWVTPGAPIPTPDTSTYANTVGAFEGAAYQTTGMFRPKRDCRMRTLGVSFCPVCKEGHILKLFEKFRIVDAASPALGRAEVPSSGSRQFSITPVNVNSFTYRWLLGGVLLPDATNTTLVINSSQVTASNLELRVEATHVTTNVRAQAIVQTNSWQLQLAANPSIAITDPSVLEGDSASRTARFTVTLSFPHTQPVSVNYMTTNGSAVAPGDFTHVAGTLVFPAGTGTNFIDVPVRGDTLAEGHETFFVNLSAAANATIADRQGAATILDDDIAPTVELTNPAPGLVLLAPVNVSLGAQASDLDGVVKKVEFYADFQKIGQVTNGPTVLTWTNVPPGSYLLRAVATDNTGRMATSAPVALSVVAGATQRIPLVAITNLWRYDQTTNDYGTAWRSPTFNDAAWEGPSPALFYNESASLPAPKLTPLLLTNGARLRTYYFRTTFVLSNALDSSYQLVASNLVDDGAVFYLNGSELGRLRVSGTPTRTTLASAQPTGGDATAYEVLTFPASAAIAGTNVLAVEVHQQSDTSSDVVFGMTLAAVQGFAPVIVNTNEPADRMVLQNRPLVLSVIATGAPPPVYQWFREGNPLANATGAVYQVGNMAPGNAGNYFVRVTNQIGTSYSRVAYVEYVADSTAPVLLSAMGSNTATRIFVAFSEPVVSGATVAGNYTVTAVGPGTNLVVSAATALGSTGVVLTTSARLPGLNYLLTVNNVRDALNNVIAANSQVTVSSELVALAGDNQAWRFYQWGDAPAAGWAAPNFDDTADHWLSGLALFDAKNPPGRTTVNTVPVRTMMNLFSSVAPSEQTTAYFFRAPFYVPGYVAAGTRLRLRTLVDDGAIFYVNGQEALRLRMPEGPVSYATLSTSTQGDAQNVFEGPYELPVEALVQGTNIFAVEVHQGSETSSDISFAAELMVELPWLGFAVSPLAQLRSGNETTISWNGTAVLQEAPTVTGPWSDVSPTPRSPFTIVPTNATRFFRLRAP